MQFKCDVAVVGAGPAGSICALRLAASGMKVFLFDASVFPRCKPCGGGVQQRAVKYLPSGWENVRKSSISRVRFSSALGSTFEREACTPIVHLVARSEFDSFLADGALREGARLLDGTRVLSLQRNPEGWVLATADHTYSARYVVGADGANSVTTKLLNKRSDFFWQAAIFVDLILEDRPEWMSRGLLHIDWGTLPAGYGWVFPRNAAVNIGVGGPLQVGKMLRSYLPTMMSAVGIPDFLRHAGSKIRGHQLPTLTSNTVVSKDDLLLVGDAAGMVEPFMGEGISYACHSGALAAQCIIDEFGTKRAEERYSFDVTKQITSEIICSRRILSVATAYPRMFFEAFRSSDQAWRALCQIQLGTLSFASLRDRIGTPLGILASSFTGFVELLERMRLDRLTTKGTRRPSELFWGGPES